jgi:hypothetical protein
MRERFCRHCGAGEMSPTAFGALVARSPSQVRAWLEAGKLEGRRTPSQGRWRVAAAVVLRARRGELTLPDGSRVLLPRAEAAE